MLGRSPREWRAFFERDRERVRLWFNHFAHDGRHTRGARALCNFALARRDIAWGWIVWAGKHAQAPVVVANKLHYFCEVDIFRTLQNFVHEVPEFWSSDELWETLETGEGPLLVVHNVFL